MLFKGLFALMAGETCLELAGVCRGFALAAVCAAVIVGGAVAAYRLSRS